LAVAAGAIASRLHADTPRPVVSVVKILNGNIDFAVEHAIELLRGMRTKARSGSCSSRIWYLRSQRRLPNPP
jgi:hypothetical protein